MPGLQRARTRRKCAPRGGFAGLIVSGTQKLGFARRKVESGRHHADDRGGSAADAHRPSEDAGIAAEAPLPGALAEDDDVGLPRHLFFLGEAAPKHGIHLEEFERVPRDRGIRHALGPLRACERGGAGRVCGDAFEDRVLLAPIQEVGGRDRKASVLRHHFVHADQTIRIRVGQWLQEHPVDDAEDDARCADPERERQHCHDGEARRLRQLSNRISHVAQ